MKKKIGIYTCMIAVFAGACAGGGDSIDAHGRALIDLGEAPRVSHLVSPPAYTEVDREVADELAGVFIDQDGHEYYAEALDGALAEQISDAFDRLAVHEEGLATGGISLVDEGEVTLPRVLGGDGRRAVGAASNTSPFSSIGEYTIQLQGAASCDGFATCSMTCSGTLIGSRYVALSAHCIYDRGPDAWIYSNVPGAPSRGTMCFNGPTGSVCRDVTSRKRSNGWRTSGTNRARHDFGLLRLSSAPAGIPTMNMSSRSTSSLRGDRDVSQHGYPGTRPNGTQNQPLELWGMDCRMTDVEALSITHNCDTTGGHSGGPVYYLSSGGTPWLIGIHSGGAAFGNGAARVAGTSTRDWLVAEMVGW